MKQCINKLLLLIATSSMIAGSHIHSMEQDASAISTTTSTISSTTTLLEEFRALPDVLRRYIIFLALEDRLIRFLPVLLYLQDIQIISIQ